MNPLIEKLDKTDISILKALQADGRLSVARLSEKLALSETPCWRRLKRLELEGFIEGYQANLNRKKLGYDVVAFVQVTLGSHAGETPLQFERLVASMPEILACHNVTGELALVVAAQVGSCAVAPTLVARPAALLLTACDRGSPIGAPAALCVPAGQGARDPTDGLVIAAGLVLLGSQIVWAWPLAALVRPADDDDDDAGGDVDVG